MFALRFTYPAMFSLFQSYDDEGYALISLKSYLSGLPLYSDVYSQYGPFYYLLFGGLFRVLRLPVTHDIGRLLTVGLWVGLSMLIGLLSLRITRSLWVGAGAFLLSIPTLYAMVNEPMHPGGLAMLLVLAAALFSTLSPRVAAALTAGAICAAALVKINVGTLAAVALIFALSRWLPANRLGHSARIATALLLVATPALLMRSDLQSGWASTYAGIVGLAALGVVVAGLRFRPQEPFASNALWRALLWGVGVLTFVGVVMIARGTSLADLVTGSVIAPMRQPRVFAIPIALASSALLWTALGTLFALLFAATVHRFRSAITVSLVGLFRIAAGIAVWFAIARSVALQTPPFAHALAFAWVAAVPPLNPESNHFVTGLARSFIPAAAVLQTLHAYPVAGSQVAWASLLLIAVGALCIGDGIRDVWSSLRHARGTLPRAGGWVAIRMPAMLFTAWLLGTALIPRVPLIRLGHDAGKPLGLHGASRIHLPPDQVNTLQRVTSFLRNRCSTFVSEPGLNSFYLFADQTPPTGLNATAWPTLFNAAMQDRIVNASERIPDLCVIREPGVLAGWTHGVAIEGPLSRYIAREFLLSERLGTYELLIRQEGSDRT